MNRVLRSLLRRSLGKLDSSVLLSELEESYRRLVAVEGRRAANRWHRKEVVRAIILSSLSRFRRPVGQSRQNEIYGPRRLAIFEVTGSVVRDIWFGVRTLRKKPLFTTISIGTLGLGIGASTAIFSVVDAVLLRPLPYVNPGELLQVWETFPDWLEHPQLASDWDRIYLAWPDYERWRDGQTAFRDVALYGSTVMTMTGDGAPERIPVGTASASLLAVLGVRPILGRGFLPGEDGRNAQRVALIGYATWRDRFGADPELVGGTISLNSEPFTVVGILAKEFRVRGLGIFAGSGDYPVWIPVGANNARLSAGDHSYDAVARLRPEISEEQALAETAALLRGDRSPAEMGARLP